MTQLIYPSDHSAFAYQDSLAWLLILITIILPLLAFTNLQKPDILDYIVNMINEFAVENVQQNNPAKRYSFLARLTLVRKGLLWWQRVVGGGGVVGVVHTLLNLPIF